MSRPLDLDDERTLVRMTDTVEACLALLASCTEKMDHFVADDEPDIYEPDDAVQFSVYLRSAHPNASAWPTRLGFRPYLAIDTPGTPGRERRAEPACEVGIFAEDGSHYGALSEKEDWRGRVGESGFRLAGGRRDTWMWAEMPLRELVVEGGQTLAGQATYLAKWAESSLGKLGSDDLDPDP